MYILPEEIKKIVGNLSYKINEDGRSGDIVIIFEDKYVLKISEKKQYIFREKEMNDWLYGKIQFAKSIVFIEENGYFYYLRTNIIGKTLIDEEYLSNPNKLIQLLKEAVYKLLKLNQYNCPYKSFDNDGSDFVHGDLCLPNILVNEDKIVGFIDLGNSGIGDKWYDISWLLWSLEYNLKTDKYNELLLKELGITFSKEKYEKYINY